LHRRAAPRYPVRCGSSTVATSAVRKLTLLPNSLTLANAFCGLLAIAKSIDALTLSPANPVVFYQKMEAACFLIFLGMIFDALDGPLARATRGSSPFGAQLDSFSDALTFGIAPAIVAKVLIEHEGELCGYAPEPRLVFLAAAAFALMAILRLVRFTLSTDAEDDHDSFQGLPSPAAAGAIGSTIWLYLILRRPELESSEGTPTPLHKLLGWMKDLDWDPLLDVTPQVLFFALPVLGLLMVSRLRYVHFVAFLTQGRSQLFTLVGLMFCLFLLYLAPVPNLFFASNGFVLFGLLFGLLRRRGRGAPPSGEAESAPLTPTERLQR
jgi:CDP-diacylglycerol--serine O-phosphatidyltransferase